MHIVFISYWGLNQGLTKSTVLPHLEVLSGYNEVEKLTLITFERSKDIPLDPKSSSWDWTYIDETKGVPGLAKFISIRSCYKKLISLNPDFVIARSSLAGIAAYYYHKKTGKPYSVESFEPHAQYMADAKEWRRGRMKYRLLEFYENKQMATASFIMPVANGYEDVIQDKLGNETNSFVLPCTVDADQFQRQDADRIALRKAVGVSDTTKVGVYVGKFGGLYQEKEAFQTFKEILSQNDDFFMIVLSPTEKREIISLANEANYPIDKLWYGKVDLAEVPKYLSASDIAFATYKLFSSNRYLSPIKVGEYLANGLFVLLTDGVGDEHLYLSNEGAGCVISKKEDFLTCYADHKPENSVALANRTRGRHLINEAYDLIIDFMKQKKGA